MGLHWNKEGELQKNLTPSVFLDGDWCRDISNGVGSGDIIERSCGRLPLYKEMESVKIDVSKISAEDAAEVIADSLFPKYNNGKDRNKGNPK